MCQKWHYDSIYSLNLFKRLYKKRSKSADKITLVDTGCGDGGKIKSYLKFCSKIVGLDTSIEDLKKAQKVGIDVINGDAQNLPFSNDAFEIVTSFHVIEHLKDDLNHLREIFRILKRGGGLIIVTPNLERLTSKLSFRKELPQEHLKEYTFKELSNILHQVNFASFEIHQIFLGVAINFLGKNIQIGFKNFPSFLKKYSNWLVAFAMK